MADLPMSLFFVCVLNFFILLPATTLGENVVAWSQSSLNNKIASDMTIELVADIPLNDYAPSSNNSGVYISDIVNLTLIGNNYEINSQNMLRCLWVESSTISIQHMHVRSCTATGNLGSFGGGMVLVSSVATIHNITVSNCKLSDTGQQLNQFYPMLGGAAIFVTKSSLLRMSNSSIVYNSAVGPGKGGGLSITNGSTVELESTYIAYNIGGNVGGYGGGVYVVDSNITFSHCTLFYNKAAISCNADITPGTFPNYWAFGGGFCGFDSLITLSDTHILGNYGVCGPACNTDPSVDCQYGGGSYTEGTGSTIIMERSEYKSNRAVNKAGAGMFSMKGTVTIIDSYFYDNSVGDATHNWAGAIYWGPASGSTDGLYIYSTTFSTNNGGVQGGALYIYMNTQKDPEVKNEVVLSNVNFDHNVASTGSDILMVMLTSTIADYPNFEFYCIPGCDEYGTYMTDGVCTNPTAPVCQAMDESGAYPDCGDFFPQTCYASCASTSTNCHSCLQNQYNPNPPSDNEVCTTCPNGTVIDDNSNPALHVSVDQCVFCPPGKEVLDESSECTPCLPGFYKNVPNAEKCAQCAENYYNCGEGSTSCIQCQPGTYADKTHTYCTECGSGQYVANSSCIDCPSGKYAASPGSCIDVPAGSSTLGKSSGADTIAACNGGTYSEGNAVECSDCLPGRYSGVGSGSCALCDAGKQSSATASVCMSCAAGKYSPLNGSLTCLSCLPGKFSVGSAASCTDCTAGLYSNDIEQAYCLACSDARQYGPEYTSYVGASNCTACVGSNVQETGSALGKIGYYYDKISNPKHPKCVKCSSGMLCKESNQELETIKLKKGWYRFSKTSNKTYDCPVDGACDAPANFPAGSTASQTGNAICSPGYKGPLCSLCQNHYGYHATTGTCEKCSSKYYAQTLGIFFGVIAMVGLVIWGLKRYFQENISRWEEWSEERRLELDIVYAHISVFLITVQTGILINENQEAAGGKNPPNSFAKYQQGFSFLNLNVTFFSLGCFFRFANFFTLLIVQTMGLIFVCSVFAFVHWRNMNQSTWASSAGVQVMKFFLPTVTLTICRAFRCEYFDHKNHYYLLEDMSINCRSSYYKHKLVPYAVLMMIILPFGVTLFTIISLFRARMNWELQRDLGGDTTISKSISDNMSLKSNMLSNWRGAAATESDDEEDGGEEDSTNKYISLEDADLEERTIDMYAMYDTLNTRDKVLADDIDYEEVHLKSRTTQRYALYSLCCDVKDRYWYMEVVDMVRRLLLTCFPIIFTKYGAVIVFSLAIALLALVYQQEKKPYLKESMNKVKMMESYQNLLFIIVLLIQNSEMFSSSVMYETAGGTLIATNLVMFLMMFISLRKDKDMDKDKDEQIKELRVRCEQQAELLTIYQKQSE